ncbi:CRISPR-associated endonuclease Cas2 [Tuberibacillus calidus]|uniref:CRISPR-associated endonuclease Cas2 n=1 Tax=Tuberibacillus calidus TaxID=340097 RepID=UPI000416D26A|nr:CRISPR-associated endonuclease Cas2 [Tuberibacillus calidus]
MYVIITYDVAEERVAKVHKKLKEYLIWSQNSVFEGEMTKSLLKKCLFELENIIDEDVDSINIYEIENPKHLKKSFYGVDKSFDDMFL